MKSNRRVRLACLLQSAVCTVGLLACGGGGQAEATAEAGSASAPTSGAAPSAVGTIQNPILFAAQVPTLTDFASRASTFGNHRAEVGRVARGGDLMVRYPDGTLRNLTKEASFGMEGFQGAGAIAVREPSVHWGGKKALFSMVIGAATAQFQSGDYFWQIYEVSGLGKGETATITTLNSTNTRVRQRLPGSGA
jgi:hypothetical protein